jgi:endonuclease III related protein
MASESAIREYFSTLYATSGRQHWWPAESAFEVIAGAILTQNTAWTNVELALAQLRKANALTLDGIRRLPITDLEQLIRSAGFFRQKAARLKTFVAHVDQFYRGSLDTMFQRPTAELRAELLRLNGIGPETADSILLYAGQHETFVVDAYTRRILERHALIKPTATYEDIRNLFERALTPEFAEETLLHGSQPPKRDDLPGAHHAPSAMSEAFRSSRAQLFNEMHGLLVGIAKNFCQARQVHCERCPLGKFLKAPVKLPIRPKKRPIST